MSQDKQTQSPAKDNQPPNPPSPPPTRVPKIILEPAPKEEVVAEPEPSSSLLSPLPGGSSTEKDQEKRPSPATGENEHQRNAPTPAAAAAIAEKLAKIQESTRISKLYDFSRGAYPCLWYKFKRFEGLSLFNLYLLQDELVQMEKTLRMRYGVPSRSGSTKMNPKPSELEKLNGLLKEYREYQQYPGHHASISIRR